MRGGQKDGLSQVVLAVDIVLRESIYGYHGNRKTPFLKITMALPKYRINSNLMVFRNFSRRRIRLEFKHHCDFFKPSNTTEVDLWSHVVIIRPQE